MTFSNRFSFCILCFCFIHSSVDASSETKPPQDQKKCAERITFKNVTDSSMQGRLDSGQQVQIDEVYYSCRSPKRGDLLVVQKNPFVASVFREVVAIPGDTFELVEVPNSKNHQLKVNAEMVKTPKSEPFEITPQQYQSFRIWAQSFKNEMPPEHYFVLSTEKIGQQDSRDYGPVVLSQVRGKISIP